MLTMWRYQATKSVSGRIVILIVCRFCLQVKIDRKRYLTSLEFLPAMPCQKLLDEENDLTSSNAVLVSV